MSSVLLGHVTTPSGKLLVLDPRLSIDWRERHWDRAKNLIGQRRGPVAIPFGTNGAESTGGTHDRKHDGKAVVVDGIPIGRRLPVYGELIQDGLFEGRFRRISVSINSEADVACSRQIDGVMVNHGQLICADLGSFREFRMWEPSDGLADYVMQGRDDAVIAHLTDAPDVFQEGYGWKDVPMGEIDAIANRVSCLAREKGYQVSIDYRPHCNLEKLNAQIRSSETQSGTLRLGPSLACGFRNRWGDGLFPVCCDYDTQGKLVRVSMDVGNDKHQHLMRQVYQRHQTSVVTKRVWEDGEAIQLAQRYESRHQGESGWFFSAGTENDEYLADLSHFAIVTVKEVIERCPGVEAILDASENTCFRRQGSDFFREPNGEGL